MEFISAAQLKKYENILNEIDSEFKKSEQLKQDIERETNKLTAVRIATGTDIVKAKVYRVTVKIFSSVYDVHYLYGDNIQNSEYQSLAKIQNCKIYVVQVYISKLFQQKLLSNLNQNWVIDVNVKNDKVNVSKSIDMRRKQIDDYIAVVVPFDDSIQPSVVTTHLLTYFENFCYSFKLSTVHIDISYHFGLYQPENSGLPYLKMLKNYNSESAMSKVPVLEYNFKCKCTNKHFFETVVRNCYHRLKPELFSAFAPENDSKAISLSFSLANQNDTIIKLDNSGNSLSITSSNLQDLHAIKKYFIEELICQDVKIEKMWLVSLANIRQYLRSELRQAEITPDSLKIIHKELKNLIASLPV